MVLTSYPSVFSRAGRFIDSRNPILLALNGLLSRTLKLDYSRLSIILTLFSLVSTAISASSAFLQIYEWVQKLFMVSVCVPAPDELYGQVLAWVAANVLKQRVNKSLFAQTKIHKGTELSPEDFAKLKGRRKVEIEYLPCFRSIWFLYERRPFMIKMSSDATIGSKPETSHRRVSRWGEGERGKKKVTLTVSSIGRSQEPIRRFLKECRSFSEKQQQSTVAIHKSTMLSYMEYGWEVKTYRPTRRLDSVHLDEEIKSSLVSDIEQYLDPRTRQYYTSLNIPYRRGYLLHGPPGTGKTSLSVALAAEFGLDLFIMDLSTVPNDEVLDQLFQDLPSPCIVLLEDIDVVGIKDRKDRKEKKTKSVYYMECTLSGLLNALDGVASSEGRILMMTTNQPDQLDEALLRPGRVDRKVYFGHVNQHAAEQMFLRMYGADLLKDTIGGRKDVGSLASIRDSFSTKDIEDEDLADLATIFSKAIPEETFSPAQLQEYLLRHRGAPVRAVEQAAGWVAEEKRKREEKQAKLREANNKESKEGKGAKESKGQSSEQNSTSGSE